MEVYNTLRFKKKIHSDYLQEDIYNLLDKTFVFPKMYSYDVFETTEEYIARPDLISYDAYGDTRYADIICKINGISNPFELNEKTLLILPSPEYIDKFNITPYMDEEYVNNSDVKQTKTKQDKRQPNEAIVGDTRFKIDSNSRIIMY